MNHPSVPIACLGAVILYGCTEALPEKPAASGAHHAVADSAAGIAIEGTGAKVDDILLARDDGGGRAGEVVMRFGTDDNPLHGVIRLNGVKRGTSVGAVWMAVEAGGVHNHVVASRDLTAGIQGNVADFSVSLPRAWPEGRYRVDVYLDGILVRSREFEIDEDSLRMARNARARDATD